MVMTAEQNRRLTQVGPGTEMGNLLRRYWHPVAPETELLENPIKETRLLGEDLVLYRTRSGRFGLIEPHCPHRRAALKHGYVEDDGIRCSYHGWKYALDGSCIEQPYEEAVSGHTRYRERVCALAYRAEAFAGLVWAYLGPDPAPLIPNWEPFTFANCYKQIMIHYVDCNWLQCQENSIDPVHFEWLHGNWISGQAGEERGYTPRHVKLGFDQWEYGFAYRRLHVGEDETSDAWTTKRLSMMPNVFAPSHFEWRVPIDDRNTLSVIWMFDRVAREREPFEQDVIPYWYASRTDEQGRPYPQRVLDQDVLSWTGQGAIADRTKEHLGRSDEGVVMFRKQLEADLKAIEEGRDPTGVIRDPIVNECIRYPNNLRDSIDNPPPTEVVHKGFKARKRALFPDGDDFFFLMAGQPKKITAEWKHALGMTDKPE